MSIAKTGIDVMVTFILASIAVTIGVSFFNPISVAVNNLTAQITLIFVVLVFIGVALFMSLLGKYASSELQSWNEPITIQVSEPEPKTVNCKNCGGPNVDRVTCEWCGQVLD